MRRLHEFGRQLSGQWFWRFPGHLIWLVVAYLPFLGGMSVPLTGDQKVYLSTALEMRARGSWIQPFLFGEPSYYKPPIQYWATLAGWEIFGLNFWGTLIPSVACVLLSAWFVSRIAIELGIRNKFVNAGLWFGAALGSATYGLSAQMEIYLCLFYSAAWWAGLLYLSRPIGERTRAWLYAAFVLAGLLGLVKSPLYSVFWVAGYVTLLFLKGEWDIVRSRHFYLALFAGIVAGAWWYGALFAVDGQRFWGDYFGRETFEKIGGNGGSILSLWGALLRLAFPFTLFSVLGLAGLISYSRRRNLSSVLIFAAAWAWPPALFFTFYPYRNTPYLFVLVPLLAVLADWGYFRFGRTRAFRVSAYVTGALYLVVCVVLAAILGRIGLASGWIVAGFVGIGVFAMACAHLDWMRGFALTGLAGVLLFHAGAVELGEADIAGLREQWASRDPGQRFGMLDEKRNIWHEVGLLSVALGEPMVRIHTEQEALAFLGEGGVLALSDEQAVAFLPVFSESLQLDVRSWPRWKTRLRFPYEKVVAGQPMRTLGSVAPGVGDESLLREFKIVRAIPTQ